MPALESLTQIRNPINIPQILNHKLQTSHSSPLKPKCKFPIQKPPTVTLHVNSLPKSSIESCLVLAVNSFIRHVCALPAPALLLGNSAAVVTVVRANASSTEEVIFAAAAATTHLPARSPGFTLVHAGGVLADDKLPSQYVGGVRGVAAPKVGGAIRLLGSSASAAGASGPAVFFSSIASLLGAAGQVNYSAANAALDATAWSWRRRGVPTLSVQWGAWVRILGGGRRSCCVPELWLKKYCA